MYSSYVSICHATPRCARFFPGLAPRHHLGLPGVQLAGKVLLGLLIGVHLDAAQTAVESSTSLEGLRQWRLMAPADGRPVGDGPSYTLDSATGRWHRSRRRGRSDSRRNTRQFAFYTSPGRSTHLRHLLGSRRTANRPICIVSITL